MIERIATIGGRRAAFRIRAMAGRGCTANERATPRGPKLGGGWFLLIEGGTNLVTGAVVRSPPMLTDDPAVLVARANSSKTMDSELGVLVPICSGILHEFRNHLTLLSAATTEVKAITSLPAILPEMPPEISQALMETESNVRRMTALMAFIDAAVSGGTPAMVELDGVIERALRLVAPALGRVAVSFNKPSHIQVRNEGTALECLIAGLIVELARAGMESRDPIYRQQIDVFADVGRGAIVLEIDSSGRRPGPGSWRIALARELAARLGASVTSPAVGAGFVVRLDSRF
jgi:hypothetical protein